MIRILSLILVFILLMVSSGGMAEESPQPPGSTSSETGEPKQSTSQTDSGKKQAKPGSESTQNQGSTQPAESGSSSAPPSSSASSPQEQPATQQKASEQSPGTTPSPAPAVPPGPSTPAQEEAAPKQESAEKSLEATEEEKRRTISTAEEQTGASFIRGRLELDIAESYSHSDSNTLFIEGFGILPILTVGNVSVQRIRRDTWTTTFTARYKLTPSIQLSISIPYQFSLTRNSEATGITAEGAATPRTDDLTHGRGLGDVNGGVSYALINEGVVRPAVYIGLGLRARTGRDAFETANPAENPPTGSGFNIIGLSASFVKVADPAVISGSFTYSYAISRHNALFMNGGNPLLVDINPGDGFGIGLSLSYALNYKISLSTSIAESVSLPTRVNGRKLNNSTSNAMSLTYGVTWRWTEKTSLGLSVTQGLNLDSPATSIGIRIPYRF